MADQITFVLRNGRPVAPAIDLSDPLVVRGDGCFEALRSYGGRLIGLAEHLERLTVSAAAMFIPLPPIPYIGEWVRQVATHQGDGVIRVYASNLDGEWNVHVLSSELPPLPGEFRLMEVTAPWHPGGHPWELAGVKSLSYAPNMAAGRVARMAGYDEALLISREGLMLEGPTFTVMWVVDGTIETPSLDLGILNSVTRRIVLGHAAELGIPVNEGHFPASCLDKADEVAYLSSVTEVTPVVEVGERDFEPGPVTAHLARAYQDEIARIV
ncbi:MAG: hypothetical protein F4X21_05985 [Acidimicrobiia bacterium]|nr:hypothetical protein [Acidimicrobiia bacterium]